ncbi:reverse transcriptase domain-containing protein [Tanacetum coccineum]
MADHSQKWHDGTISRNIGSSSSKDGLAVRNAKFAKEKPHLNKILPINKEVKQVKEIDNRPPYGEKRQNLEELLAKHQEESERRSTEIEGWIKKLQDNDRFTSDQETSGLNKLHGVSFISRPGSNTPKVLQHQLPPKELNPRSFTLPYTIGKFIFYAMADLSASVNVMPRSIFKHLHLTNLKKTNMLCEMADMSKKAPLGIVENVLVKIDKFLFPSDFVILDNTPSETTILGRPFLATIHVEIDVFVGKISLGINKDRISFDTMRKDHNYMNPSEKNFMVRPQTPGRDDSVIVNNLTHRSFDDYKWEFNLEIDKLEWKFDKKRGTIFNSNKEVVMISPRVRDVYVLDIHPLLKILAFLPKPLKISTGFVIKDLLI